jgi:hypothetical protein
MHTVVVRGHDVNVEFRCSELGFIPATGNGLLDQYIETDVEIHENIREQIRDNLNDR